MTYEERIGPPDAVAAGIGYLVISFAQLEESLDASIGKLLRADQTAAAIVCSEISYKAKVHILASLVHARAPDIKFNVGPHDQLAAFQEIVSLLFRAEEFRNQVLHSAWDGIPHLQLWVENAKPTIVRRKSTAKANRGLSVKTESLDGDQLLDMADFMLNVDWELNSFFLNVDDRGSRPAV